MDAPAAALPKRRLNFSIALKQQAIAWISGPGMGSPARAAAHFRALNWEVTPETMDKWWRQRDKIMTTPSTTEARAEKTRWDLLSARQELTLAAVIRRRARKVRVSAKWIALAVRQMYPEAVSPNFHSVSTTWLHGFTERHGLSLVGSTVVTTALEPPVRRSSGSTTKKNQSARTMALHDVLYEEKPAATTIAA